MSEDNGKELVVPDKGGFSLQPKNIEEAERFAKLMASSDFVPKDYKGKAGNVLVAVQMGAEVGLKPMAALQNIAVINGRPCIWGDAALAIVKSHPDFEWISEMDDQSIAKVGGATCRIKRRNEPEVVAIFTIEDAEKANLLSKQGPWSQYPNRMMKMRARGFAMRDSFPDALKGLAVREEVQDLKPAKSDLPEPVEIEIVEEPKQEPVPEQKEKVTEKKEETEKVIYISKSQIEGLQNLVADYDILELDVQEILANHKVTSFEEITPKLYIPISKDIAMKGQQRDATKA